MLSFLPKSASLGKLLMDHEIHTSKNIWVTEIEPCCGNNGHKFQREGKRLKLSRYSKKKGDYDKVHCMKFFVSFSLFLLVFYSNHLLSCLSFIIQGKG